MEDSGSEPMDLMSAAVGSHWGAPKVYLVYFAQKGSHAGFLGLFRRVNWSTASEVICSPVPNWTTKWVSPLWCEKPGKLGDFKSKSKRILRSWAGYMKPRGLRNALGCLLPWQTRQLWHGPWAEHSPPQQKLHNPGWISSSIRETPPSPWQGL